MVDFWIYDVIFMAVFTLAVIAFLTTRKKDLSREGIMFMYRTSFGLKAIKYIGDNFKKLLHKMQGVIISIGLILMALMLWMLGQTLSLYVLHPEITKVIKAPPIAPLIPYFPKIFGMESFFPPFYFTYFIVALAVVAIAHEFSHGIFMRTFKIKIKSTGLVFLGPILGAFVEEDRGDFVKKKKSHQMTVLGAGVFANILMALLFYGLYVLFFFTSFQASGYVFDSYGIASVPLASITGFENTTNNLTLIKTTQGNYYLDKNLEIQLGSNNGEFIYAYEDAPAIKAQMKGAITEANGVEILNQDALQEFLQDKNPGDTVHFKTTNGEEINEYNITLASRPDNSSKAYLGVGNSVSESNGVIRKLLSYFMSFKDPTTYYTPTWDGEFVYFIYHLFWWVMVINLMVAMFNMLPFGILDGGRFFYLAIFGITKSDKAAKRISKIIASLIIFIFILMMFYWFIGIL